MHGPPAIAGCAMAELPPMTKEEWERFDRSLKMAEETQAPVPVPQKAVVKELNWPPGVTGALAQAIYHNSARPVQTVAIATALAILAGVCGRGLVHHTQTRLNPYLFSFQALGVGAGPVKAHGSRALCLPAACGRGVRAQRAVYGDRQDRPPCNAAPADDPYVLQVCAQLHGRGHPTSQGGRQH